MKQYQKLWILNLMLVSFYSFNVACSESTKMTRSNDFFAGDIAMNSVKKSLKSVLKTERRNDATIKRSQLNANDFIDQEYKIKSDRSAIIARNIAIELALQVKRELRNEVVIEQTRIDNKICGCSLM